MMNNNQKASDFIVLWTVGATVAYIFASGMAMISSMEHFSGLQSSVLISPQSSFGRELALAIISLLMSIAVFVLVAMNAINYFRNGKTTGTLGIVAGIGFLVLVGFRLCLSISDLAAYHNVNRVYNVSEGIITLLNIFIWGIFVFDVINASLGVWAFWFIFRKAEIVGETDVDSEGIAKGGIAADVATHAMGRPRPPVEAIAEAFDKKAPSQADHDPLEEPKPEPEPEPEPTKKVAPVEADGEKIEDKIGKLDMIEEAEKAEREKKEIKARKALGAKKKKELPPILSVNPDNDMLGKIRQDGRMLKIEAPTFGEEQEKAAAKRRDDFRGTEKVLKRESSDDDENTLPVDKSDY